MTTTLTLTRNLHGAKVVIVGLGVSGVASALLAKSLGADVVATDTRTKAQLGASLSRALEGVKVVLGGHTGVDLISADFAVISPGVPNQPMLRDAEKRGARLISEIEFASWFVEADVVAVGGTNGKSTTTELCAAFARTTGRPVFAGGNLGVPLAQAVMDHDPGVAAKGILVVEVSSFQMERVAGFRPKASILLNVTHDHLDRYPSFEAYAVAKGGAFKAQTVDDVAIVPHGDELCARIASLGYGKRETIDGPAPATLGLERERVVDRIGKISIPRGEIPLLGRHNITNLCAAWAGARAVGAEASKLVDVARSFEALPHRMALVAEIKGVRFYDDSKGTNVGASVTALQGLAEDKVVLIAGGRDKGGSYAPLVDALSRKGRALVVIGEAAEAIAKAARGTVEVERASTMEDAVDRAASMAKKGDAVLLSPACSSFDMFRDYKHRGEVFVAAVKKREKAR